MIYSITYDLKKPGQDYSDLINAIKSFGTWAKPCESYWLVSTNLDAQGIFAKLKPYIDQNDSMLITRVDLSDRAGWLSQKLLDWMKENQGYSSSSSLYR